MYGLCESIWLYHAAGYVVSWIVYSKNVGGSHIFFISCDVPLHNILLILCDVWWEEIISCYGQLILCDISHGIYPLYVIQSGHVNVIENIYLCVICGIAAFNFVRCVLGIPPSPIICYNSLVYIKACKIGQLKFPFYIRKRRKSQWWGLIKVAFIRGKEEKVGLVAFIQEKEKKQGLVKMLWWCQEQHTNLK